MYERICLRRCSRDGRQRGGRDGVHAEKILCEKAHWTDFKVNGGFCRRSWRRIPKLNYAGAIRPLHKTAHKTLSVRWP